jgi:hypothetical protein
MPIDGEDVEILLIIMVLKNKKQKIHRSKKKMEFQISWIKQILRWNLVG